MISHFMKGLNLQTVPRPVRRLKKPVARAYLRSLAAVTQPNGVDLLGGIFVLNMAHRPERLRAFSAEARRLKLAYERIEAVADENGIVGCTLSHAAMLRLMLERGWKAAMICEDDVRFLISRRELDVLVASFLADKQAEVACLAFNLLRPPKAHNSLYFRAFDTQTTACYIMKGSIAAELAELFEEGARHMRDGGDRMVYGLDLIWKRLQPERVFLVPMVRAAIQEDGWSDIEKRHVSYGV
jgi:glycosyl transferase, family 25